MDTYVDKQVKCGKREGRPLLALIVIGSLLFLCLGVSLATGTPGGSSGNSDAQIEIVKYTNGLLVDKAPGPLIPEGEVVIWSYTVNNTGTVPLTDIRVKDDREGEICEFKDLNLEPGKNISCTKTGTAQLGQYKNTATVVASAPFESNNNYILLSATEHLVTEISNTSTSYYKGVKGGPAISIEKLVSVDGNITFHEADESPGPVAPPGSEVVWKFVVNNTGQYLLQDVTLDDPGLNVVCPTEKLLKFDPGDTMICYAIETAEWGPQSNDVNVSGFHGNTCVYANDSCHYFGTYGPEPATADISVSKSASVETIQQGDSVEWTIVVTNNGPDTATGINVTEDASLLTGYTTFEPSPAFSTGSQWNIDSLDAGESKTFTLTTAFESVEAKTNQVTVTADSWDPVATNNTATDRITVIEKVNSEPSVQIQKVTEWGDQAGDGLIIPAGASINWNYTVTNNGNTVLNQVAVVDDLLGSVTCPREDLESGESMICLVEGTAITGYYENSATVTAYVSVGSDTVTDSDTSYYYGNLPGMAFVRGKAFNDTNGNGSLDDGEAGILSVEVTYENSSASETHTTDTDGTYVFVNLPANEDFTVTAALPSGFFRTTPGTVFSDTSVSEQAIDFGYAVDSSDFGVVYGTVFEDADQDGTHDLGETGFSGVTVNLQDPYDWVTVETTLTDEYGRYTLRTDETGYYYVTETNPEGYVSTTPDNVWTALVIGTSSVPSPVDFGDFYGSLIYVIVIDDRDADGTLGSSDSFLSGATVTITNEPGTPSLSESMISDSGWIRFLVPVGSYTIRETNPAGYVSTNAVPIPGATKWDDDALNITISSPGEIYYYLSFLDFHGAKISGMVFNDTNVNGSRDTGETGLGAAAVRITNDADTAFWMDVLTYSWSSNGTSLWSGKKDLIDRSATFETRGGGTLTFDTWYDIEEGWDFGFVQVSTDGGNTWTSLANDYTTYVTDPSAHPTVMANLPGLTGSSGGWIPMTFDLSAYAGEDILISFRYVTDWATTEEGWYIDNVAIDGVQVSDCSSLDAFSITYEPWDGTFTLYVPGTGNYILTETNPWGYVSTNAIPGSPAVSKIDADTLAMHVGEPGTMLEGNLFGDAFASDVVTISGQVVNDTNGNGRKDGGEDGLAGAVIALSSGLSQTTGPDGQFVLYGPKETELTLTETNPSGYRSTNATAGYGATKVNADTIDILALPGGSQSSGHLFLDTNTNEIDEWGTISVLVFKDANSNAMFDSGDTGIPNVEVTVFDSNGLVATAYTDSEGRIEFADLVPGEYTVIETDLAGYASTTANIQHVTVSAGGEVPVAFGDRVLLEGRIGGTVFHDLDANGEWNDDEPGISEVSITLTPIEGQESQDTTNDYGQFTFTRLKTGSYTVTETDLPGYVSTTPNTRTAAIDEDHITAAIYFGDLYKGPEPPNVAIWVTVFHDLNENRVWDGNEQALAGVGIALKDSQGTTMATAVTNTYGQACFTGLTQGTYTILEENLEGYISTTPDIQSVVVEGGAVRQVYFGDLFVEPEPPESAVIWATVFNDQDGNKVWNDAEPGIGGVQIHLKNETGTVAKLVTDTYGHTYFSGLAPGMYDAIETDPANYESTTPNTVTVTVDESAVTQVFFGDRLKKTVPPTPKPEPGPHSYSYSGSSRIGSDECDFIETGTLSPSSDGYVPRTITICAVDGIGKLVIGKGTLALTAGASPLEYAVIKPLQVLPYESGPGFAATGYGYDLYPLDATFQPTGTLLMEFTPEEWATIADKPLVLRQWNSAENAWEEIPTTVDANEHVIYADVGQLSIVGLFEQVPVPPVAGGPAEPAPTGIGLFNWFPYLMAFLLALLALLVAVWWSRRPEREEIPRVPERPIPGGVYTPPSIFVAGMESAFAAIIGVINDIDSQLKDLEMVVQGPGRFAFTEANATAIVDRFFYATQVAEERMKDPNIRQYLSLEQIEQLNAQLQAAVQKMILLSQESEPLREAVEARIGGTEL